MAKKKQISEHERLDARESRAQLLAKIQADAERDQALTEKIRAKEIDPQELEDNEGALFDDDEDEDEDDADDFAGGDGDADDDDEDGDEGEGAEGGAGGDEGDGGGDDGQGLAPAKFVLKSVDELNKMSPEDLAAYHTLVVGRPPHPQAKRTKTLSNIIAALAQRAQTE